jgi:hypothetical protein
MNMSDVTIKTNHHWHAFASRLDVPADVLASQFNWTNEGYEKHSDYWEGFLCYRGHWYHIDDFMRGEFDGWQGCHAGCFSSGVLINISDDGERYQIATYAC